MHVFEDVFFMDIQTLKYVYLPDNDNMRRGYFDKDSNSIPEIESKI